MRPSPDSVSIFALGFGSETPNTTTGHINKGTHVQRQVINLINILLCREQGFLCHPAFSLAD